MELKRKLIAILTLTIIIAGYILPIGNHVTALAYLFGAQDDSLENQKSTTNVTNVQFNSYLEGNTYDHTFLIEDGGKMYIELKVEQNGYLKNGIVEISDANYKIVPNENTKYDLIQNISENRIELKQINNSENSNIFEIPIQFIKEEKVKQDIFNKISQIKFTGIYVNENGEEKSVEKVIRNNVKWNSKEELQAQIEEKVTKYVPYQEGEEYGVLVQTKVNTKLQDNKLPIAKTELTIKAPGFGSIAQGNLQTPNQDSQEQTPNQENTNSQNQQQNQENTNSQNQQQNQENTNSQEQQSAQENTNSQEQQPAQGNTNSQNQQPGLQIEGSEEKPQNQNQQPGLQIEELGAQGELQIPSQNEQTEQGGLQIQPTTPENEQQETTKNLPKEVKVLINHTMGTNGAETETNFAQNYNKETGEVTVIVENQADEQNNISWKQNANDEYLVNYIYKGKEIYDLAKQMIEKAKTEETGIVIKSQIVANITVCQADARTVTQNYENNYVLKAEEGKLTDFGVSSTNELSKAYIYANYAKAEREANNQTIEEKQETKFNLKYAVRINYAPFLQKIELQTQNEKFINEQKEEYSSLVENENAIYNKTIKVSQEIFTKFLGEEGKIEIRKSDDTLLGELKKDSYELNIEDQKINEIKIITTKPLTEGLFVIEVEKTFAKDITKYTKQQVEQFKKLKTIVNAKTNNEEQEISQEINLLEPVSKMELTISKPQLTTVMTNEDVEITALLNTSSLNNALYKNPTLEIYMPEEIEDVKIKSINVTPNDELKEKEHKVEKRGNQKVLIIKLDGTQTKYTLNSMIKGTNVVVKADIKAKEFTPTKKCELIMNYTNENSNLYENTIEGDSAERKGQIKTEIEILTPGGVVAGSGISNYAKDSKKVMNLKDEKQVVELDVENNERIAEISGKVINHYSNPIANVRILGRTTFAGNKKIDTQDELGSTFTLPMTSGIAFEGNEVPEHTIYYSTVEEATTNIEDENNKWVTEVTDFSEIKSYLIVFTGEIVQGTILDFNYHVKIPKTVQHDNIAYSMYKIYYENKQEIGNIPETKESVIIGMTSGFGPKVEVSMTSSMAPETALKKGDKITYTIQVKNAGTLDLNNLIVTSNIPKKTTYIVNNNGKEEESEISAFSEKIENIKVGETKTYQYTVMVGQVDVTDFCNNVEHYTDGEHTDEEVHDISEYKATLTTKAEVCAVDYSEFFYSEEVNNTVKLSAIEIELSKVPDTELETIIKTNYYSLKPGDTFSYIAEVKNAYVGRLNNVAVQMAIPEGLSYKSASKIIDDQESNSGVTYNISGKAVKIDLGTMDPNEIVKVKVVVEADSLPKDSYERNFETYMEAKTSAEDDTYASNHVKLAVFKTGISISQSASVTDQYIYEGDELIYEIEVHNTSGEYIKEVTVEDTLPDGLNFEEVSYQKGDSTEVVGNSINGAKISYTTDLEEDEILKVRISSKVADLVNGEEITISNTAHVITEKFGDLSTNQITHTVQPIGAGSKEEPIIPDTYRIGGAIWLDENKDGIKQKEEARIEGTEVLLMDCETLQIVQDGATQKEKRINTDENGVYSFINIPNGEYIAIFVYDAKRYATTEYHAEGSSNDNNSDANTATISLDGENTVVAITDKITISNGNVYNLDLGLVKSAVFDLKIDKYINNITVTITGKETKNYQEEDAKFQKVEVRDRNIGKTSMVVEYRIVVTNEGTAPGYVRKIADYVPEGMQFRTEINSDWYLSDKNGNLYNTSLENEIIQPGESKEVKLVLSKQIQRSDVGNVICNKSEIYESYNEQGLTDMDSQEANLSDSEDDLSLANIIISAQTGQFYMYIGLTMGVIAILVVGIIFVLRITKKENN